MTTLTIRPSIRGAKHRAFAFTEPGATTTKLFADIADLVKLNEPTGQLDEDTSVYDLQRFFEAPNVDKAHDLRLWTDSNGKLLGFGQLLIPELSHEIEGYLYFDVHPTQCRNAIEAEILQWSEQRMREIAKQADLPVKLRTRLRNDKILRQMLLKKQGFTTERRFLTMGCTLAQPLPSFKLPDGFTLRSLRGERDIRAWVELFNESFIDHWNHQDVTAASVRHWLKNPHYKPELNLVAVAPNNTFAAFCVGYINQEENVRSRRNEGWIKLLGTRRGFRKLGLGRAMLLAGMRQLKAIGVERVKLGVDAQSLTHATRLYESLGFQPIHTWLSYVKEI
ncbi:GNAT family N-acetyltransferase [Microcoleus sp. FACHB-SPT15]|uniref:GNAT family N-acetyltransferase n=1 Tax=Microcoleus sp. FACHB-SPT15 TaxID=2692830 RepID=UPI00177B49E9|nr:GNAT family N-acetyltransferase [Microcoleus sp. FACHB-SPT15]MBD1806869.1 GNAT family N-acetyltransferase [Microcoleus sp. FACHB-SPT15]